MSPHSDDSDPQIQPDSQDLDASTAPTESPFAGDGAISSGRPAGSVPGQPDAQDGDRDLGTAGGNPLAGLIIDPADAEQAAPGDEGPLNPGQR